MTPLLVALGFLVGGLAGAWHAHKLRDASIKLAARVNGALKVDGKWYIVTEDKS